jgi:hypothetical protein
VHTECILASSTTFHYTHYILYTHHLTYLPDMSDEHADWVEAVCTENLQLVKSGSQCERARKEDECACLRMSRRTLHVPPAEGWYRCCMDV